IEVHGHTDSDGNYDRNMELSQMRAESVCKYFVSQGIASSRVRAVGIGSKNPVGDNKTAEGRARNRRIEIVRSK
ncbi:MAG: OmpA family protein, partial [Fibrobacter sp.]|nr:OmpA family protein [Fibrobacter sp.]